MRLIGVAVVLAALLAGCGETAEQKYARALTVWKQEVEIRDRLQDYVRLLESNKLSDKKDQLDRNMATDKQPDSGMDAIEKEYAAKLASANAEVARQDALVEKARKLLDEAEAQR
jgi:hypothetical protein